MKQAIRIIEGIILDPVNRKKIHGRIYIKNSKILKIEEDRDVTSPYILPGFVDSHIHIESSMLLPSEFSKTAIKHGTVAVVADPHEIANVAGIEGVNFMINEAKTAKLKFFFGAPSCVPAAPHDDCFKVLDSKEIESLLIRKDIHFLGEMMNYPGVINQDPDVIRKIEIAKKLNKPIDGHAPALTAEALKMYADSGISTDHECFTKEEALEKISLGMKVLIREGSAAKNYNTLNFLIENNSANVMFCTDDCHPDDLVTGHMNLLVKKSLSLGYNIFDILQVVSVNPVKHYNLNVGLLQIDDPADFIIVDSLENLSIQSTFIEGLDVLKECKTTESIKINRNDTFQFIANYDKKKIELIAKSDIARVIIASEGELITDQLIRKIKKNNLIVSNINEDILKIVVVNRYKENEVYVGLIKGFGIKKGAIAESIAHDSHHIIAVGTDDSSIIRSLDYIIENKGGICYFDGKDVLGLPLPVYGLMSYGSTDVVAKMYNNINFRIREDGCLLKSPFMTLSFMALTVIPKLKISPKGLFDVEQFKFVDLFL